MPESKNKPGADKRLTDASVCPTKYESHSLGGEPRADGRTRTGDLLITNELLYQLSYIGVGAAA